MKLSQSHFSKAPETLDAVNVIPAINELVCTMIDTIMLVVADVDQSVVTTPTIGVNNAFRIDSASDNPLKSLLRGVGDYLGINLVSALQETENDGFTISSSPSFSSDSFGAEIALIDFHAPRERAFLRTDVADSFPHSVEIAIDSISVNAGDFRGLCGIQIRSETLYQSSEFRL